MAIAPECNGPDANNSLQDVHHRRGQVRWGPHWDRFAGWLVRWLAGCTWWEGVGGWLGGVGGWLGG